MKADQFRKLALDLPEAAEGSHQGHADFRVRGKIFATLGPDEDWAMVKVTTDFQDWLLEDASGAFEAIPGAWGRQGCTRVWLKSARKPLVREALSVAWRKTAPKRLVRQFDEED